MRNRIVLVLILMQPLLSGGAVSFAAPQQDEEGYLARLGKTTTVVPADELRALWVVRHALTSLEDIDRLVDFAINARFHLLFVQVRGRGDAYYISELSPQPPRMEFPVSEFDPLDYLLARCHQAGISVHAWLNVFYVWSNAEANPPPDHVAMTHPEWLLMDEDGVRMGERSPKWWQNEGLEGYYLSPTEPAVRDYIAAVMNELVTHYAIDGVHLDYVRYPGLGFGLNVAERTRFMLNYGVDPARLVPDQDRLSTMLGDHVYSALDSLYLATRTSAVDSMVLAVRAAIGTLPLSAAVAPDPERARIEKGQDWVKWVDSGMVDFVVPMLYTLGPRDIQLRVRVYHNTVGRGRILPGLAVYGGRQRYLEETVKLLRELPVTGACLFSYNALTEQRFAMRLIDEAFFSEPEPELDPEP